jgi:hypothetical protein
MPCYEERVISVEFKAGNSAVLLKAIDSLGFDHFEHGNTVSINRGSIVIDLAKGTAVFADYYQDSVNKLKQAYSREAIKVAAKKFAWATKTQGNNITVNKVKW